MKFKDKTRGGHPFTLYTTEGGGDRPVHGRIVIESGEVMARDWFADGHYATHGKPHPFDLIPLREPSAAAVEAARSSLAPWCFSFEMTKKALRAAYEIDFPEGGK
ncbi:hypothetical protein CNY89_00140 [Amaricoccus sp. HAR-UPW-R2A-40]|nr:hypothetical protein CNY89_00140 [Amaricoccus sp. HAR-UPW-R2A-40]